MSHVNAVQWHMVLVSPGMLLYPQYEVQHLAKVLALLALCHGELISSGAGTVDVELLITK